MGASPALTSNPYGLSDQDFSDLQQIRSSMKDSDPRAAKIDTLLATRPQTQPFLPQGSMATPPVPRPPQVNMQQSLLGHQDNSDPDLQRLNRGIQAGNTAPMPEDAFIGAAAAGLPLGGVAAAPAAGKGLSFLYNQARQHPFITSTLINQARGIPVIGKHVPAIADVLPFLLPQGQNGGPPLERDATRGNVPFAGEAEEEPSLVERDATRQNLPYAGEEELTPEEAAEQARQSAMPRPLRPTVGSAQDWQQYEDQMARLKQEASDAGTYSAARGKTTRKLNYQQRIERSY